MKNFLDSKIKNTLKWILAHIPFGLKLTLAIGAKRAYRKNFGKIKFQGEYFQDMLAYLCLQKRNDGFFIDIGARDGVIGNNTYALEQLGWKGICIEPQPDIFEKYLKPRRKCECLNVAVSSRSDDNADFFHALGADALSGLNEGMSEAHKAWAKEYGKVEIIKVKTMTFDEIMERHQGITHIDFLSVDVEGHEMEILKTIDFKKYTFGFLTVEKSEPEQIIRLMKENGYNVFMEIGADIMFVPET